MIQSDKRPVQDHSANITEYSLKCPKGKKSFFAYAYFTDSSYCLYANIFASNRTNALLLALKRFADCTEYLQSISLHEG